MSDRRRLIFALVLLQFCDCLSHRLANVWIEVGRLQNALVVRECLLVFAQFFVDTGNVKRKRWAWNQSLGLFHMVEGFGVVSLLVGLHTVAKGFARLLGLCGGMG